VTSISQSFTYKMAAKSTGIDTEKIYVIVALCIRQCTFTYLYDAVSEMADLSCDHGSASLLAAESNDLLLIDQSADDNVSSLPPDLLPTRFVMRIDSNRFVIGLSIH